MSANRDLFEIAKLIRSSPRDLSFDVIVTPPKFLMDALRANPAAVVVVAAIDGFLDMYGHQGYSMDFVEPTQSEDPSGLFATLKNMVGDPEYDPDNASTRAAAIRTDKFEEVRVLLMELDELHFWQFQHRLWLARK
jgi:hypothetical protein